MGRLAEEVIPHDGWSMKTVASSIRTQGVPHQHRRKMRWRGPCEGESLKPLKVVVKDGVVWLK